MFKVVYGPGKTKYFKTVQGMDRWIEENQATNVRKFVKTEGHWRELN